MKIFFTVFLVLNLLAETLAAVSLIGAPNGLSAALDSTITNVADNNPALSKFWSMHYGFALFLEGTQTGGIVLHSILALMAIVLFALRGHWCHDA